MDEYFISISGCEYYVERTISMSKRASDSITPAPKQQRVGDHTPVTSARPHGRVVLNVGGAKFESSKTT